MSILLNDYSTRKPEKYGNYYLSIYFEEGEGVGGDFEHFDYRYANPYDGED